jgi:hypothetical protein
VRIAAHHVENLLCQIQANRRNLAHGLLSPILMVVSISIMAHCDAD